MAEERNPMLKKYKAVFFDVGGTLIQAHPSVGAIYAKHARPFGYTGAAGPIDRQFALEWRKTGGLEALGSQTGETAEREFWRDLAFRVFQPFGGLDNFDAYFEIIYDVFRSKESWRIFEDVRQSDLLGRLKRRGIVVGVISNWDSRLRVILENMDLARHFDFILASSVVGSAKPDAKIFQTALQKSGVAASAACHIGDSLRSDFLGARSAGMDAILIDRKGGFDGKAVPRVRSFLELV